MSAHHGRCAACHHDVFHPTSLESLKPMPPKKCPSCMKVYVDESQRATLSPGEAIEGRKASSRAIGTCSACQSTIWTHNGIAPASCSWCGAALTQVKIEPSADEICAYLREHVRPEVERRRKAAASGGITEVSDVRAQIAKVLDLPAKNVQDIPARLRTLADQIEAGEFGAVKQLAWVVSDGVPRREPEVGLLGAASSVPGELHLLLTRGARVVEK